MNQAGVNTPAESAQGGIGHAPELDLAPWLPRLEQIARAFIGMGFQSPNELWRIQSDLLAFQRELQASITDGKTKMRRNKSLIGQVKFLRGVFGHARRLGDAIAWVMLGGDRHVIYFLSQNSRVPVEPAEGHGERGLVMAAAGLSKHGWGFPILHDITQLLRIGDITFVKPDDKPRTVEIKTHLTEEHVEGDELVSKYVITTLEAYKASDGSGSIPSDALSGLRPRIQRQVKRLSIAHAYQSAPIGELVRIDGIPTLMTKVESDATNHLADIQQIVDDARQRGFAAAYVDDIHLYVAFYNSSGLTEEYFAAHGEQLRNDMQASGLLSADEPLEHNLLVSAIPSVRQMMGGVEWYLPYYLLPLPLDSIMDMLNSRLTICDFLNVGKLILRLKGAGYQASISDRRDISGSLRIAISAEDGTSDMFIFENTGMYLREMVNEFQSMASFIDRLDALRDAARLMPVGE